MDNLRVKKVAVIGAGVMGRCIGLEFARFGYEVVLHDLLEEQLEKSLRSYIRASVIGRLGPQLH